MLPDLTALWTVLICVLPISTGIKWIALSSFNITSQTNLTDADFTSFLDKKQSRLLHKDQQLLKVVYQAAKSTIELCESQFNESRWNCSSLRLLPEISPELSAGTREQAYVYALSSAILTVDMAKACSYGLTKNCECASLRVNQPKVQETGYFHWNGCDLNLKPAMSLSKRFTDSKYKRYEKMATQGNGQKLSLSSQRIDEAMINLHNTQIGRQSVKNSVVKRCKCHGISGSCEMKTCWREINQTQVEADLMDRYLSAIQYYSTADNGDFSAKSGVEKRELDASSNNLIFNMVSSDYCNFDVLSGSLGTSDRKCSDKFSNVCGSMCCGRGTYTVSYTKTEQCRCRHIWCCKVVCDTCTVTVTEIYCK